MKENKALFYSFFEYLEKQGKNYKKKKETKSFIKEL